MHKRFDQKSYLRAQIKEALGNDNKWYAGEFYHHTPSNPEALEYYISHSSGAIDFSQNNRDKFFTKEN